MMNNMRIPVSEFPLVALYTYITEASVIYNLIIVSDGSKETVLQNVYGQMKLSIAGLHENHVRKRGDFNLLSFKSIRRGCIFRDIFHTRGCGALQMGATIAFSFRAIFRTRLRSCPRKGPTTAIFSIRGRSR